MAAVEGLALCFSEFRLYWPFEVKDLRSFHSLTRAALTKITLLNGRRHHLRRGNSVGGVWRCAAGVQVALAVRVERLALLPLVDAAFALVADVMTE